MNKKITILANDTTYIYNLRGAIIKKLVEYGYKVYVVAEVLNFEKELKDMKCEVININVGRQSKNAFSDLVLLKKYKKILKTIKPSIVLSYNIKPNVYGGMACQKLNIRFFPNITGLGTALEYPGLMQKITKILNKKGLKKASAVFFQNAENMSFFEKNHILNKKSKKILLPGSGVDLKKHKLLEYPKEEKIKFLFVARIMKDKGIDIFLESAKRIKQKYPNTEFHICGYCDNAKYKKVLKVYEKNNYIIYHGEQTNMIPYFRKSHIIVHPSYYPEGMSNVLLEAAAHGRPIICTDRSGCRETVDDTKTGFLVPIKDVDCIIEAEEKFINMPFLEKKEMGLNGRKKIEKEFDRRIVVKKYMEELNV